NNDYDIINLIKNKRSIILLNKTDLDVVVNEEDIKKYFMESVIIPISAKNNQGIDVLYDGIKDLFFKGMIEYNDQIIITNSRQKSNIKDAIDALNRVNDSISNDMPEDFLSIDMMEAYEKLGMVIGEGIVDDLVDTIFREFCMGK
ncbi:MAG: tRNA uridine-5-carboxymethylaminomethyl(34) synthesis GTPase MnmE, partial [Lachnospiraceae bacterium]|nr:tRNA uridine-5-carboxymethylaminomethyl(34) synthesis GTPase MnmE [Lachnospiraceae bacterium]